MLVLDGGAVLLRELRDVLVVGGVLREEGAALARSFGCDFLETSAKTSHNVERLFTNLVRALRQTRQLEQGPPMPLRQEREKKRRCIIM